MIDISSILVLIGMFGLRIGIPIAVIAVLVYALKRLDRQWEQEARAQRQADAVAGQQPATAEREGAAAAVPATPAKVRQPVVIGYDMPGMQPPPGVGARPLPGMVPAAGKPCWESKHCSADKVKSCPAAQHPEMACWQSRLLAEGHMPDACPTCEVFQRYPLS